MENIYEICIDKCEQCISATQELVGMCSANNSDDCAKHVGIAAGRASQCIDICKEVVQHSRKWLERAKDDEEKKRLDWVIKKSQDCIDKCEKLVQECTKGKIECLERCHEAIEACTKCAHACNQILELNE